MGIGQGYLTYTMAAIAVIWGLIGWYMQWIEQTTALEIIWGGLTVFGIRRAIKA